MEEAYKAVELARAKGLPKENYWLYFKKNSTAVEAYEVENKRPGWLGFFVENDSRIPSIVGIVKKKTIWKKYNGKGN